MVSERFVEGKTFIHTARLCPAFIVGNLRTCLCAWIVSGERDWKSQRALPSNPNINIFLPHLLHRLSQNSPWEELREAGCKWLRLKRPQWGCRDSLVVRRCCCPVEDKHQSLASSIQIRQLIFACNSKSKAAPFWFTQLPTLRWNIHIVITHLKVSNRKFYKTHIQIKAFLGPFLGPWKGFLQWRTDCDSSFLVTFIVQEMRVKSKSQAWIDVWRDSMSHHSMPLLGIPEHQKQN